MDWLKKLQTLTTDHEQTRKTAATEATLVLWRRFVLEADKVYRSSPKSADSWNLHKQHRKTAQELCNAGNTCAAKLELEKALAILRGVDLHQQQLL